MTSALKTMSYKVILWNQHAQCGIAATGRYPLDAYRKAMAKAGNNFTRYRGEWCAIDDTDYLSLWLDARKSWLRPRNLYAKQHSSIHLSHNGLGVEIRMAD